MCVFFPVRGLGFGNVEGGREVGEGFDGIADFDIVQLVLTWSRCSSIVLRLIRSVSRSDDRISVSSPGLNENGSSLLTLRAGEA
jgi:hypothetical protein